MKLRHYLFSLLILSSAIFPGITNAHSKADPNLHSVDQNKPRIAKGVITDTHGEPLPGVSVTVKGTQIGSHSDIDGSFSIEIPSNTEKPTLVFSFIGMDKIETAPTETSMNIVMQDNTTLKEVVVTGIFKKAKESYTGAASSLDAKDLQNAGNRSILSSIQNLDPSFNIAQDFNAGSDPNATQSITIRGSSSLPANIEDMQVDTESLRKSNQPLFVLNGFEISLERFKDLDDNQIENVTILKDASATAVYGSKGSNGVVVITTRRPEVGSLQVTYKGSLLIEAPDLRSYSLMNAKEKLAYEKAAGLYSSDSPHMEYDLMTLYNQRMMDAERGVDTYWLKYPVRTGVGSKHSVIIEGGDKTLLYNAKLSHNNTEGAMKGSYRNTTTGSMFLMYTHGNVSFQNELEVTSMKAKASPYGKFQDFADVNAYYKPYDDEGNLTKSLENYVYMSIGERNKIYNPLYNAKQPSIDKNEYTEIQNRFAVEWFIIPDLFFRTQLGLTIRKKRNDEYLAATHTKFDTYTGDNYDRRGSYVYGTGEDFMYEIRPTLNYSKTINETHQIFAGIGVTVNEDKTETYRFKAEGISTPNMDFIGMANQYEKEGKPYAYEGITRSVGALFNGNYTYNRKYFIDVSGKYEGSSLYGSDNRFTPFWSTGIGWNLGNEDFLKDNSLIDVARLRLSYGVTGDQAKQPYLSNLTYKDSGTKGYLTWPGVFLHAMGNNDLGWSKTKQLNIGADLEFVDRRLRINVDVYNKLTDDQITDVTLPSSSGFMTYQANIGQIENKGVEMGINGTILKSGREGLTWMVGATMIYGKNTVKKISNSLEFLSNTSTGGGNISQGQDSDFNPSLQFKEGEAFKTIYAVRSKGIDPSNGKEIFIKADGTETYIWDSKDQVGCGVAEPKYMGGFNTTLRYNGFILSAFFNYRYGGQMYNRTLANRVENILPFNNADKRAYYDRWKEPGDISKFKSVKDKTITRSTDRFVMDENTLTCSNITIGYDVPSEWSKKHLYVSYLSLRGNLEDVFYVSSVKQERGYDYPYSRKFSLTLTARF